MRELIDQGFAIRRGRKDGAVELAELERRHAPVRDTDVSSIQRPFALGEPAGVASTVGLTPVTRNPDTVAGHNTGC